MTEEYKSAVMQAQENLTDLKERGDDAIGDDWGRIKKRNIHARRNISNEFKSNGDFGNNKSA